MKHFETVLNNNGNHNTPLAHKKEKKNYYKNIHLYPLLHLHSKFNLSTQTCGSKKQSYTNIGLDLVFVQLYQTNKVVSFTLC